MSKANTVPNPPSSNSLHVTRHHAEQDRDAAKRRLERASYAAAIDREDADARAELFAAQQDLARIEGEIAGATLAIGYVGKCEALAAAEKELADREVQGKRDLATIEATADTQQAMFDALLAFGEKYRAHKAAERAAMEAERRCAPQPEADLTLGVGSSPLWVTSEFQLNAALWNILGPEHFSRFPARTHQGEHLDANGQIDREAALTAFRQALERAKGKAERGVDGHLESKRSLVTVRRSVLKGGPGD